MKSKFDLLFEQVMSEVKTKDNVISVDTFEYTFTKDNSDNILCEFETLNDKEELLKVIAHILNNGTIQFEIINNGIKKTITEKSFMIQYYKDYEKFKNALKKYNTEESQKSDPVEKQESESSQLVNSNIPAVKSFQSKLNEITKNNTVDNIKANGFTFVFQPVEESDDKDLIQGTFELINNNPEEDELDKYEVIGIVKLLDENSVPIKFIMINPEDSEERFEIPKTDFKTEFPEYYAGFINALNQFESAKK